MEILTTPPPQLSFRDFQLHEAARRRDVKKLSELISHGWDVNQRTPREADGEGGNTPLWYTAYGPETGGVPVGQLLIRAGALPNERCQKGSTALHMAAVWGQLDMVLFLLHNGADPSVLDENGRTPSQFAKEVFESAQQRRKSGTLDRSFDDWLSHVPAVIAILEVDRSEIRTYGA